MRSISASFKRYFGRRSISTMKKNPALSLNQLRLLVVQENKEIFASIVAEHESQGATPSSTFYSEQLPPLEESKRPLAEPSTARKISSKVEVINGDSFVVARELMDTVEDAKGKTAVLNLASDERPGGGWEHGSIAQEECLCYSSTLFHTLTQPDTLSHYPWPNTGPGSVAGIFSEGVVVFRGPLDNDPESICPFLPHASRKVLSVISVAAPRFPSLTPDGDDFGDERIKEELKEKVRLILRMAGRHGKRYLVLGAMGCGAYQCPPPSVARLMKTVLLEKEFEGWFTRIVFAVFSISVGQGHSNFEIFRDALEGVKV